MQILKRIFKKYCQATPTVAGNLTFTAGLHTVKPDSGKGFTVTETMGTNQAIFGKIQFDKPFSELPSIVCGISNLNNNGNEWQWDVYAVDVTANGFTFIVTRMHVGSSWYSGSLNASFIATV